MKTLDHTYHVTQVDGQDVVEKIHKVVVHTFTMGDVEDPDLYAAEPLHKWEHSEVGQWVMEHAVDTPEWHRQSDQFSYGHKYAIIARIRDKDLTWFNLKYA